MRKAILLAWLVAAGSVRGDIINDRDSNGALHVIHDGKGQTFTAIDKHVAIISVGIAAINPQTVDGENAVTVSVYDENLTEPPIASSTIGGITTGHDGWLDFVLADGANLTLGVTYTLWVEASSKKWGIMPINGDSYPDGHGVGFSGDMRFRVLTAPLPGACCLNGGCLSSIGEATCTAIDGAYAGDGTSCNENVCDPHACCTRVGCFEITELECIAREDWQDWLGARRDCSACTPPIGACCLSILCVPDQTEDDCLSVSADWAGPLTDCNACPPCEGPDFDGDGANDSCDLDIDNDGIGNEDDVCDFTPLGLAVQPNGTVPADLDGDCNVDLRDYAIWQLQFTGP